MEILEANEETHGSIRQKINGNFAETVSQNMIGQPNGVAGLDPDGNIVASVVPLGNTWLALKDVVLAAGERAYCVDTTETFTGDGTSAIKDMWASSCDKYEVDRGSNGAAEFERVRRAHGLPVIDAVDESFPDLVGGARMIVSNADPLKANNKLGNVATGTGFVKMSLYDGSTGAVQPDGIVNIEDAVGLVAPYTATEILMVACDAAGVEVDVGSSMGLTRHNSKGYYSAKILAYQLLDVGAVNTVASFLGWAQRLYPASLLGFSLRGCVSQTLDLRHLTPDFSVGNPVIGVANCTAESLLIGPDWGITTRLAVSNCRSLTEVLFFGGGPLIVYMYGTALGVDGVYSLIDSMAGSSARSLYIDFCPFATAFNGSGTQAGQTHTVADVVALAAAKNVALEVYQE